MRLVGTSGWQYADWRGRFYPNDLPRRAWLRYYASRFPTLEVNNTFYRLPTEQTFARWKEETPPGFVFVVKASRFITHIRRLRDGAEPLRLLLERAAPLGDRLGPVLFQLPPSFPADRVVLRDFLTGLPSGLRAAFEFRDRSWRSDEIHALLQEAGAALVLADRPRARVPDVVTSDWTYVRFHQGTTSGPRYRREKLRRWADRLENLSVRDAFIYFNNDTGGAAIRDARAFAAMIGGPAAAAVAAG
jgi:uncharacterized protein YecE (DUF72 family)